MQGGIIMEKLRKEQIEALHVDKIRDQYDILEKYLTAHKFMATNYVSADNGKRDFLSAD